MSFQITLQPAARSFAVERDEAILPAAIRQGISLPYGCRDGACGSCKSKLIEGRVIHGAHQLKALSVAEEEEGFILTCCATPQTDCVIEAINDQALCGVVVAKRRGIGDPAQQLVAMTLGHFAALLTGDRRHWVGVGDE